MSNTRIGSKGFFGRLAGSRLRFTAVAAAVIALAAPVAMASPAAAAGTGVLTITMEPVDVTTGSPQTWAGMTGFNVSTELGYRISYSCSVGDCLGATIQLSPGPLDPTYNTYRHLLYKSWTAPFLGATIGGTDTTGKLITLGDLANGASGSFTVNYLWSNIGNANASTIQPAQFFPQGFPIVMSATGASSSITNTPAATAAPVEWRSTIRDPSLAQSSMTTRDAGTDVTYTITMNSGCLPTRDTAAKGDSRFTCAKSYTVVDHLDPRATFVSATGSGVYDPIAHTVTWSSAPAPGLGEPAAGWYRPGNSSIHIPRTVTVRYDAEAFSPGGTDPSYCNFTESVTNRVTMNMIFLGAGGMADDTNVRDLEALRTHNIVCVAPFAKATFSTKLSTFDGPNRYGNGNSPIVVQPDTNPNEHVWVISVGNQANVPGVAVIEEPDLAIEGTKPQQIQAVNASNVQQNDATISWQLNTGVTGTSTGIATAPVGTWFVAMTVTSGPLAGPNLLATGTAQTVFTARVTYAVRGDAPVGQTRTNTATARMTYPGYPTLADIDLGSRSHTLQYLPVFGRALASKDTTNSGVAGNISIPATGSTSHYWSIVARNTGNAPGVAVIEDLGLDGRPVKVVTLSHVFSSNNVSTGVSAVVTLNTGTTVTTTVPYTAPGGTWITAVTVTTPVIEPVNALSTQNVTGSYYELRLGYLVPSTTLDGSSWTNTAQVKMTYPGIGIPDVNLGDVTRTVTYGSAIVLPSIGAAFVGAPVVEGGGQPVPGRNVTFTVRGSSLNAPTGDTFTPQYVFIAPEKWSVTPGSAAFVPGSVPAGVTFTYKTVTIGGVARQAVIATWPTGTTFGLNTTWPSMTVDAQPTALALAGSSGVATAWMGEASHNWTTGEVTFSGAVTDTVDMDADGTTTEGFATANATALTVGSASQLTVIKEICFADPAAADGCAWVAEPGAVVGVDPAATDIEYRVRLVNAGNTSLTNLVAYDVLPYLGDMGTSAATSSIPRGSTFAELLNSVVGSVGVSLAYSASSNPCRAEVYPAAPGCVNDWNTAGGAAPGAKALRITATSSLAPGAEVSVHYKAAVVPGAAADSIACNSVAAKVTQIGTPSEPLAVCASTQEADLEIVIPARLPLQVDRPGVLPFTVTNNGGSMSAPALVDIEIPSGVRVTGLTPAGWSCVSSTGGLVGPLTLTCSAVTALGGSRTLEKDIPDLLEIPVVPLVGTDVCFDAEVYGRMSDPDLGNNDATACFDIAPGAPELILAKDDGRTTALRGDEFTYTLTVTNGLVGEALTGVVITDTLPAELEFVAASDGGTFAAGVVTWPAVDLAAAGTATAGAGTVSGAAGSTLTRTVTVKVAAAASDAFTNEAQAVATDPADLSRTLTGDASDTDDLLMYSVSKTVNAPAEGAFAGEELTYTVQLTNEGTAAFPGTVMRDDLSDVLDDADFVSGSGSVLVSGSAAVAVADPVAGVISWTGTLPASGTATITYRVLPRSGGDGALANTAFTSSSGATCDAVTGQDDTNAPCAATLTYFSPLVAKAVESLDQNDDGTWTIVYGIEVTNRNPDSAIDYDLNDDLNLGVGFDVTSAAITTAPGGVTPAAWSGSGSIASSVSLPAGATHLFLATVIVDALDLAGTVAGTCVDGMSGGFANTATIVLASGREVVSTACAEPTAPTIEKSAAPSTQNPDGTWNVVYTIIVTGPADAPASGLPFTLEDSFGFPSGVSIVSVDVTEPTGALLNGAFDGNSVVSLLATPDRVAAGATRVYTVAVVVDARAGSVVGSDLACPPAGLGGYGNTVTLLSGSSSTELDAASACERIVVQPTPDIHKTVTSTSIDGGSGDWTIVYEIVVTNPSSDYLTSYDLADELQFGDGITVVDAQVASVDETVSATWNGLSDTTVVTDIALPASAVHTYTVTVVATPPAVIDDANAADMDCRLDSGESGTGFRNIATLASGVLSPFAVGCEPATDPSVVKTTVGMPVQDPVTGLWSIEYALTVTNRSTTTVVGGIPYSLEDTLGFPAGTTVTSVSASGPGTVNANFDGSTDMLVASGSIEAAADDVTPEVHVYTVTVVFEAPGGLPSAERLCDPAQGAGGLRNEVEIVVGVRVTADVACADAPDSPVFGATKTVLQQEQQADGTWIVLYRLTVANPSATIAGFYDLDDTFALGSGISLVGLPTIVAKPATVTVDNTWNGAGQPTVTENVLLGGGASHQYTVRAVIDSGTVRGTDAAGDCTLAGGESGTGFLNSVSVSSGAAARDATACARAFDPAVSKTVNGTPVRNADGSWTVRYVVTVSNPSTVDLRYGLTDELDFPAGTTFGSTTVTARAGGPATSALWNGTTDTVAVADGTALAASAIHVFDVTVVATLPVSQPSVTDGWANGATVASAVGGVVTSDADAAADIEVPHLVVTKQSDATGVVRIGDTVTYTVLIENTGEGDFTSLFPAEVWDDLTGVLDDATLDALPVATPVGGTLTRIDDRIRWSGALIAGGSLELEYSVTITAAGDQFVHNVAFGPDLPGGTPSTPTSCAADACAETELDLPGFLIEKSASAGVAVPHDVVSYTVVYTNTGLVDVPDATFADDLSDVLDDAVLTTAVSATSGSVSVTSTEFTWTGALAAGASVTVTYEVTVTAPLTGDHVLINTATSDPDFATRWPGGTCPGGASSCGPPPRTVDAQTGIRALAFTKVADATRTTLGQKVTYTVTVTNLGAADYTLAEPAVVVDSMSGALDDAAYNGDVITAVGAVVYSTPQLTWTGPLTAGQTITFRYSVTVNNRITGDGRLDNIVGLTASSAPTSSMDACLAAPVDNAQAHCFVSLAIAPLAATGSAFGIVPLLVAILMFLVGSVFFLLHVRRSRRDREIHT